AGLRGVRRARPSALHDRLQAATEGRALRCRLTAAARAGKEKAMFFLSDMLNRKLNLPKPAEALPGRDKPIPTAARHHVSRRPLKGPYPDGMETALFGLGCFWGAERLFWQVEGVWVTASGFSGGFTPNPTYQETCTGLTGHAEVVLVVFD